MKRDKSNLEGQEGDDREGMKRLLNEESGENRLDSKSSRDFNILLGLGQ
jgi:hypothetical protein